MTRSTTTTQTDANTTDVPQDFAELGATHLDQLPRGDYVIHFDGNHLIAKHDDLTFELLMQIKGVDGVSDATVFGSKPNQIGFILDPERQRYTHVIVAEVAKLVGVKRHEKAIASLSTCDTHGIIILLRLENAHTHEQMLELLRAIDSLPGVRLTWSRGEHWLRVVPTEFYQDEAAARDIARDAALAVGARIIGDIEEATDTGCPALVAEVGELILQQQRRALSTISVSLFGAPLFVFED